MSTLTGSKRGCPARSKAARRNATSKPMLWPTRTVPRRNSSSDGSTASIRGAGRDERVGEAGEHRDLRRDRPARVDERLERAEELAAADLHRADLGDRVVGAVAARRLEVEHAERDVGERRAEVVEAALDRCSHSEHETTNVRSCQTSVRCSPLGECATMLG